MNVIKLPTQVVVEDPFQMVCEITNRRLAPSPRCVVLDFASLYLPLTIMLFSSRVLELLLSRPEAATTTTPTSSVGSGSTSGTTAAAATTAAFPAFIWTGVTHQRLERLPPAASTQLSLEFVPVTTGLQVGPLI